MIIDELNVEIRKTIAHSAQIDYRLLIDLNAILMMSIPLLTIQDPLPQPIGHKAEDPEPNDQPVAVSQELNFTQELKSEEVKSEEAAADVKKVIKEDGGDVPEKTKMKEKSE